MCQLLIEEGADIDAIDRAGQTPLMSAVICYNKEVDTQLISRLHALNLYNLLITTIIIMFASANLLTRYFCMIRLII